MEELTICRVLPTRPEMLYESRTAEELELLAAHKEFLNRLHADGGLVWSGRTTNADQGSFGLHLLALPPAEAKLALAEDPAVKSRLMRLELYPFKLVDRPEEEQRRSRNMQLVDEYFRLQNALDLESWIELWAADGRQLIPFAPPGFPAEIAGRERLLDLYRELFAGFDALRVEARVEAMLDPDAALARWHTHAELKSGGTYSGDLIGTFRFSPEGKIIELTEYFDSLAFAAVAGGV